MRPLFLVALALAGCGTRSEPPAVTAAPPASVEPGSGGRADFDTAPTGAAPDGFRCAAPGPDGVLPARWQVIDDPERPGNRVLEQSDGDDRNHRYPIALFTAGGRLGDLRVAVRARAVSGTRDRSFGVVARAVDERTYYCARANTSGWGQNVRLYRFTDGVRKELAAYDGAVAPDAWHDLELIVVGDQLSVYLDGKLVIRHVDARPLRAPGYGGVWTKAESVSRFDDLVVAPVLGENTTPTEPPRRAPEL